MEARGELPFWHAFVVKADQVRKIWKTFEDTIGNVRATASCADHIERPFTSVEELVAYENARARQILTLEFSARSPDWRQESYLRLGQTDPLSFLPTMTLRVTAPDPPLSRMMETIADILDGMRPWYSRITRVDLPVIVWGGVVLIYLMLWGSRGGGWDGGEGENIPLWIAFLGITFIITSLAIVYALAWGLGKLQKQFFPMATFAIGQGLERYTFDEWMRKGVLVGGVLFGIVIPTLVSFFVAWLFAGRGGAP